MGWGVTGLSVGSSRQCCLIRVVDFFDVSGALDLDRVNSSDCKTSSRCRVIPYSLSKLDGRRSLALTFVLRAGSFSTDSFTLGSFWNGPQLSFSQVM